MVLDAALQRSREALGDGPLQARQGWWPRSPAAGLRAREGLLPGAPGVPSASGAALTKPSGAN